MLTADHSPAIVERLAPPTERQQRSFWIALACAFVFHSALLLEFNRSVPRRPGALDGSDNAIAVDIVTEADLKSRETVATSAGRCHACAAAAARGRASAYANATAATRGR